MTVKNNNAAILVFAFVGFLISSKKWKVKYLTLQIQGRNQGGPGVPVTPPFCRPFLTKQPTTGGKNAMTISLP